MKLKVVITLLVIVIMILLPITNGKTLNDYFYKAIEVTELPKQPEIPPITDNLKDIDDPPKPYAPIFTSEPLPAHIIEFITGVSFKENAPFDYDYLIYLTISYVDFEGGRKAGNMIVAAHLGDEVLEIFKEIYEAEFPIYGMRLIDYYDADDDLSMAANNTSSFNFRLVAGTNRISRHGFGAAIDINPVQNPYIRGDSILPEAGREYLDRNDIRPGMVIKGDVVYQAFTSRGWIWGGNWTSLLDYHHFEKH